MSISTNDRIKELLGNGLSNEVVASTIGVTPAYISQLMSQDDFKVDVIERRTKTLAAHTLRDRSLDAIEDSLIARVGEYVDNHTIYKPADVLRTFAVINNAKRRGVPTQDSTIAATTTVKLILNKQIVQNYVTNAHNEIVQIGEQTLVTMPAAQLLQKLAAVNGKKAHTYKEVSRYLPGETQPQQLDRENAEQISAIREAARSRARQITSD